MINSDQRSPTISSEILTGQPERGFGFSFRGIARNINKCHLQFASYISWFESSMLRGFRKCDWLNPCGAERESLQSNTPTFSWNQSGFQRSISDRVPALRRSCFHAMRSIMNQTYRTGPNITAIANPTRCLPQPWIKSPYHIIAAIPPIRRVKRRAYVAIDRIGQLPVRSL